MYRKRFGLLCHPLPKDARGKTFFEDNDGFRRLQRAFTQRAWSRKGGSNGARSRKGGSDVDAENGHK